MKHEPETPRPDTAVLEALQVYRAAEAAMRRRTGAAMGIGENDLLALRLILDNTSAGRPTFAKDISAYLGVSSASTTLLIDRLVRDGFVERRQSTVDKRSVELVPTLAAQGDTGPLLAAAQEQIAAATAELSPDEAETVTRFLTKMRQTVDRIAAERAAARPKRT
ncbi:DNA-binding transcriptional regulator, MarR family [Leifsonia sp. 98AMF]|uniref:MarR family winged helix-turn-helix transcriptional regulator n=1 Tax=Microbacteriaceae TaxID=85023 RepID=UPI0003628BB9|nr:MULTISPECIES: MarR family transcriptional regulator [Microbacteriaceae]TDP98806.1 DNA-binding MarR family transcriptional regulator [Leifsonia sp. 115AMFTsu3.1]SDH66107.1 DNA-binding transcriptional regulator, MarR family [Leifsonia sp. 197AMF]SDI73498.1 DNA-binding transcriptional regulator, MarR family [Leifsonia sp. 466MF]SDK14765.1 DNA-binding transcriptional regulator, MarR family [Leifsonia sp. 157MF]SDN76504.1 DNA-binding transcriptional regulator, MarR family [Leifsonia sp. 509MF]